MKAGGESTAATIIDRSSRPSRRFSLSLGYSKQKLTGMDRIDRIKAKLRKLS
jgi:hypothetical protein